MRELEYLIGLSVGQVAIGSDLTLELVGAAADASARLEAGRVTYQSPSGSIIELDMTQNIETQSAPLLAIQGCVIASARADEEANTLELVFEGRDVLRALPMQGVEGWQLTGPGNRLMVAVPGGEIAAWG